MYIILELFSNILLFSLLFVFFVLNNKKNILIFIYIYKFNNKNF